MSFDFKKIFGTSVFCKNTLKKYSNHRVYQNFIKALAEDTKEIVDLDLANEIAHAMKT